VVQFLKNLFRKKCTCGLARNGCCRTKTRSPGTPPRGVLENLLRRYSTRKAERGAKAKTYGVVRAEFRVLAGFGALQQGHFQRA
jgi:hypothetical protein